MDELKKCPFCGGTVEMVGGPEEWKPTFNDPDSGGDPYAFVCKCGCGLYTSFYDCEEAIEAWNRRTDEWIPCSERLPEEKENPITRDFYEYQVAFQLDGIRDVRHYKFGNGHWWNGGVTADEYITHWMPNPELPPEIQP